MGATQQVAGIWEHATSVPLEGARASSEGIAVRRLIAGRHRIYFGLFESESFHAGLQKNDRRFSRSFQAGA
jgi:hypothetical protein